MRSLAFETRMRGAVLAVRGEIIVLQLFVALFQRVGRYLLIWPRALSTGHFRSLVVNPRQLAAPEYLGAAETLRRNQVSHS